MIFEDVTPFENASDEKLTSFITIPQRQKVIMTHPKSAMMLNPLQIKHLNNIDNLNADIIVINLEDGVAPIMKKKALLLTAVFLSNLKSSKSRIIVRVNPIDKGGAEEIQFLNKIKPDSIRVSKIRTPQDVQKVLAILDEDIKLHLSIETKEALQNLPQLNVNAKVECASLGIMDMLHSLGLPQYMLTTDNPTIHYILTRFLVDSKIAGIYPIGFTYQEYNDTQTFTKWCQIEKQMGYSAKSCLGPKQVDIANAIFQNEANEKNRALHIVDTFEKMRAQGVTGFMDDDYGFIDEPIYKDALLTLEKF